MLDERTDAGMSNRCGWDSIIGHVCLVERGSINFVCMHGVGMNV